MFYLIHKLEMNRFTKHKYENDKNNASLDEIEKRLASKRKVFKNYVRASKGTITQKEMNPAIETLYHAVIAKVKPLFAALPDAHDRVIIQLNHKNEPLNPIGLFCLMTSTFYFYLEADYRNEYRVEYMFHHCPIQEEVMKMITSMSLKSYSTEVIQTKDYTAMFNESLRCQPERFITLL
jgi:hypothetical protein